MLFSVLPDLLGRTVHEYTTDINISTECYFIAEALFDFVYVLGACARVDGMNDRIALDSAIGEIDTKHGFIAIHCLASIYGAAGILRINNTTTTGSLTILKLESITFTPAPTH